MFLGHGKVTAIPGNLDLSFSILRAVGMNQVQCRIKDADRFLVPVHLLVVGGRLGVNLLGDVVHERSNDLVQFPLVSNHSVP